MKATYKIVASLTAATLLIALVLVATFWAFKQIEAAAAARKYTNAIIDRASQLLAALGDAETRQRGYSLTGDESFLEPYLAAHDSVSDHLKELRSLNLTSVARKHLDALAPLVYTKLTEMEHVIKLRRNHEMSAVPAIESSGQGKHLMELIRNEINGFIQIEKGTLAQQEAAFQLNMRHLFAIIVTASLFTLLFALWFAILIYREAQHRLKNQVHFETQHLLKIQEETNKQLQQANVTLQVSEEKLTVTLNSIGDAVIATDAAACVMLVNPVAEQLTGWTLAEAIGRPVDEIFHIISKESRQPSTIPVMETLRQGTIQGLANHTVLIARDGSECDIADSCAPIRDSNGQMIGAVLIFRDVTEEYTAQQTLRDNTALIQTILNTVVDGIITLHARGGIVEKANLAAERMFGYPAAEIIGQNFSMLIPELDRDQRNGSLEYYSASDEARASGLGREVVGRRKDGSVFPMEMAVSEMWLGGQRYFTGILRDITMRKRVETERALLDQRLNDQQFYTRSLFESNIDALMTTDLSGIITDVNQQMVTLTACTREELIGAPFKTYFTDPDRAEAAIKQVLSGDKVTNYELTARACDGKETVVSYNASTFCDRTGKLQGVVAAARDITERKRLDQVLQDKNTELESARFVAEKANLAKSDFLSSMSHELRTPLNAILGFAQLLEAGSPQPTATQIVRLHQIIKAGWYLLELINEILDLALIESGKLSLSQEPVSLMDVILECQAMIEPQAQQRNIKLTFLPFDNTLFANADRTRAKQVLINLLSNAIKYNREQGSVEVKCVLSNPERIRISIKDSGAGLPPEKLAQLFQPFNRLGQETGAEEGTGIGLVVTKQLVELMGGTIGVESTVGVGSEFWIELIRDDNPQLTAVPSLPVELTPQAQKNAALRTLLYVEDNPANLMLVEQIIEGHPHVRMLSARDGKLGIALARAHLPDVILMDINLPGISGFQVLKMLREDNETAQIPVLAISANAMPRDIEKGLEAGFFQYLTKPIKVNEFMNALDDALKFSKTALVDTNEAGQIR
ncbi:MAG: PAS domain S-box protein [Gammaproteobacteria bacterium]